MGRLWTRSVVLDTSVVAKFFTDPPRSLPPHVYRREAETREKINEIMNLIEECGFTVYYPRSGVVELASVLRRAGFSDREIYAIVGALEEEFTIVDEAVIYPKALEIAVERAPSGFDTYFLALALITAALLITDDKGMSIHAEDMGIKVLLVRSASIRMINELLGCP